MRKIIDTAMEKFLQSQQMHQKFEKTKPELLDDMQKIVASIDALKTKLVGLAARKDGNEQSLLFTSASKFHACLQVNQG